MKIPLGNGKQFGIHDEGRIFILLSGLALVLMLVLFGGGVMSLLALIATLSCVAFFRDPERIIPELDSALVAPADGIVVDVCEASLPAELNIAKTEDGYIKIAIFLNVFNVHVNRVPVAGKITAVQYHPGKFVSANLDKASEENERNSIAIETESGKQVVCVQIAGIIARRIVCDAELGDFFATGQRYGIIRFGSRVEVFVPKSCKINAVVGQTMVGGETIIAEIN